MACVTCSMSHVNIMCHISHVTCHVSNVTCHMSNVAGQWGKPLSTTSGYFLPVFKNPSLKQNHQNILIGLKYMTVHNCTDKFIALHKENKKERKEQQESIM